MRVSYKHMAVSVAKKLLTLPSDPYKSLMIYSMTGYGKSVCELPGKKITIEIKSLNSKQLDLNIRMPQLYREKELEVRNEISAKLNRGKIDVSFYVESAVSDKNTQLNRLVIEDYLRQLRSLSEDTGLDQQTDYLKIIMSLPDVVKTEQAELDEAEWQEVMKTLSLSINHINSFRAQEGATLAKELDARILNISNNLDVIGTLEKTRVDKIKIKLRESLEELAGKYQVDDNRFEQELIFYLEKLDITEERVRLGNHLGYFQQTMQSEPQPGKKLGFIAQEIGREINTIGSKANDAAIQRLVIEMKDELEKIKEQILNIL